jgi:hypothetical protein
LSDGKLILASLNDIFRVFTVDPTLPDPSDRGITLYGRPKALGVHSFNLKRDATFPVGATYQNEQFKKVRALYNPKLDLSLWAWLPVEDNNQWR